MSDQQESNLSNILRLCYIQKPANRRMDFPSFIIYIFKSHYINIRMHYSQIYSDAVGYLSRLRGEYNRIAREFMDKNPSVKNLVDSSEYAWTFTCLFNALKCRPETILLSKTPCLSVFTLIDPIKFNTYWFNGNLELIHSLEQLGENLGIRIPHPMDPSCGILNCVMNPFLKYAFSPDE